MNLSVNRQSTSYSNNKDILSNSQNNITFGMKIGFIDPEKLKKLNKDLYKNSGNLFNEKKTIDKDTKKENFSKIFNKYTNRAKNNFKYLFNIGEQNPKDEFNQFNEFWENYFKKKREQFGKEKNFKYSFEDRYKSSSNNSSGRGYVKADVTSASLEIFKTYGIDLGDLSTLTPEKLKKAYRTLALSHHPDRNPDNQAAKEAFQAINEANEVLKNHLGVK